MQLKKYIYINLKRKKERKKNPHKYVSLIAVQAFPELSDYQTQRINDKEVTDLPYVFS